MTVTDPFAAPSGGTKLADFKDRLVLFTPQEHLKDVETKYGKSDAVLTDIVVLDGPGAPVREDSVRIFQKIFVGELSRRIGQERNMLLARIVTVPNKKDENGKPVWVPQTPTDEDKQVARDYLASLTAPKDPFA
jgi:hypothetical protein